MRDNTPRLWHGASASPAWRRKTHRWHEALASSAWRRKTRPAAIRSIRVVCGCGGRAFLLALALALPGAVRADVIDRVVAVVGEQIITLSDVRAALAFGLVEPSSGDPVAWAVRRLIDRELMLVEVDRYLPPQADPAEVQQELARFRARFPDREAFERAAAESGTTDARLRDLAVRNIRLRRYLEQRFTAAAQPTDEEIVRYFDEHREAFARDGQVPEFRDVRADVQARLADARRQALIEDWLDGLRRLSDVVNLYEAGLPAR